MQNFRHKIFYKHCYPQHRILLDYVKKIYNGQEKAIMFKNFNIYKNLSTNSIFIEKKLDLYDKYGHETLPRDLFIDLPKIYNLNIEVMSHCGYQTSLYKALFYKRKYNIIPYSVINEHLDNEIINEEDEYPISILIPEKYRDECIYVEKGDELILSKVKINYSNNMRKLICKLTVDPLFFENRFICSD